MAAFNPETQDTGVSNMTGASQGQIPDRSFEALFEGLTKTFENVTTIKDTQTQLDIRKDAEEMFEGVNQEFGVSPPAAMSDELDRIQELQNAVEQGKISQVNYYGRLATLSKQLRSKYPRYEAIVDQTIQSVTGTRPANAYRDAIFSEIQSLQAEADDQTKFRRQYEKDREGEIAAVFGPDYFQNPEKYDFEDVQTKVSAFKGEAEIIEADVRRLNQMKTRGEVNAVEGRRVLDQQFNFIVTSTLNRSLGLNNPSAQESIDAFIAKGGGSPEELNQFIGTVTQVETELRAELMKKGRENFSGIVTNDEINKAVEDALYPITKAKEAVLGGDFKLAERMATINKAIKDQQLGGMLKDPTVRAGAGIQELNQVLGDTFFSQNREQVIKVAEEVAGQAILGNEGVVKNVIDSGNEKVSRATISESFRALVDPNLKGEKFSNVMNEFFGPNAVDFMSPKVVARDDLQKIYLRFLSPEVTQAVFTKGSQRDKDLYVKWAMEKASAIPEFRAAAGDLNALKAIQSPGGRPAARLTFDPKTLRFTAESNRNQPPWELRPNFSIYTDGINRVLATLKPVWEAQGIDPAEGARELLENLSVRLDTQQESAAPGFFKTLASFVVSSAEAGEMGGEETKLSEVDMDEIDFMEEQEDYDTADILPDDVDDLEASVRGEAQGTVASAFVGRPDDPKVGELNVSNKRGYTPDTKNLRNDVKESFVELQNAWGSSIPIVSGYRDPGRNARAGGAKKSQHMHGKALDLDVSGWSREKRIKFIKLARSLGWGGIGVYTNSIHIDKGSRRAWGPSHKRASLPSWAAPYV